MVTRRKRIITPASRLLADHGQITSFFHMSGAVPAYFELVGPLHNGLFRVKLE
ncbi:hypothetical protein Daudx_0717 [Candidatus Desulforudis audaxviator]|nr:hypothetical protein Daudx_0717 [Candidatus Desulforudis audaxviator]